MLAFALSGRGELLKLTLDKDAEINLSAYATRNEKGLLWITVVNKDLSRDAALAVTLPAGYTNPEAFRLQAPSVSATNHVTLAGAEVSPDGQWTSGQPEKIRVQADAAKFIVPRASALLLRLQP
jgi:hypothetical protein